MSRPTSSNSPLTQNVDGVRLAVHLTPRSRAERLSEVKGATLMVFVTAPPADNQANEALIKLLAREFRLRRSDLTIVGGARNRDKIIQIGGDPTVLMAQLLAAIAALPTRESR